MPVKLGKEPLHALINGNQLFLPRMNDKIRVRFAPSPTGGLHLGGVRTALYNYLFARQQGGQFILRIEDTDQTRYVPGAEQYILDTLAWCGIEPDESPEKPGAYGPYRQTERKENYLLYAEKLVKEGYAYYAFDTPEELEQKRKEIPDFQYNISHRAAMRNSLTMPADEVTKAFADHTPYVIRLKVPEGETIELDDMIRGKLQFQSNQADDKVLLKKDGMPTYHLAVVVDDYLMQISHVFRGEEWLPSAPVHVLLWKYLFGLENMPQWAHLPLILKPEGNGKLSKRAAAQSGFPIFAMNWTDPQTKELTQGFRERGFLPEAFINMLALLGWNNGTEQEIFSLPELVAQFSIARVHKAGARFDYEKAKWFNHEWLKKSAMSTIAPEIKNLFEAKGITVEDKATFIEVLELVKDRCTLLTDFVEQAHYFFQRPLQYDIAAIASKWTIEKNNFFIELIRSYSLLPYWELPDLENTFREMAAAHAIKIGELLLPLRIMLVGGKSGPGVFHIAALLGKEETLERINLNLSTLSKTQ